jgi:hypothetical protein
MCKRLKDIEYVFEGGANPNPSNFLSMAEGIG